MRIPTSINVYNIVHDYNFHMNGVDRADQSQLEYYAFARWLRNTKWWWAIFLHLHRIVCTNAYKIHCKVEEAAGNKPLEHRVFLQMLCERHCRHESSTLSKPADALAAAGKAQYVTPGFLTREPWKSCTITDISAVPEGDDCRCQWCRFKWNVTQRLKKNGTTAKAVAAREKACQIWDTHCSGCTVPCDRRLRGHILCRGCCLSFCNVECYREFHNLGN